LILEISTVAKGVLLNVIPLLEEELRVCDGIMLWLRCFISFILLTLSPLFHFWQYDDVAVRTLATQVVGKMVSESGSTIATTYTSAWKTWLDRWVSADLILGWRGFFCRMSNLCFVCM
jgi:hypothetical protein